MPPPTTIHHHPPPAKIYPYHILKNILNYHLKLTKDNSWSFWLLTLLVLSSLKLLKYKLQKVLNNVTFFEFEKRADQNFITQNLHHGGLLFEEKETVKTMSKGAIYEYILAFAGW